ncbi:MAG: 2-C-methyl-D-erythritol 2,4-cyclodiphosphate synthase [Acidobacteria bacterium]|nr:2-C-methyl-D-erythritol 2,4-cyclodiphosphate synthase [Acidobacteriota bacterium]
MVFPSSIANKKITQPEDVLHLQSSLRMGHGYDVHRFDAGRPLFLGGIEIPGGPGLLGHSDADVAIHALIDAMLGAAGRGDIGQWFPDNDPSLKGIRSTELLARVWADLSVSFDLVNADITIQAQVPKLAPHTSAMRQKLAEIMRIDISCINIKATTTEGLGFIGECQGMAADAVALLSQRRSI